MAVIIIITLAVAIFLLAILYSSVGHAGASGYLAAMALVTQMPQEEMKAVALTLNIFVGAIGSWRFIRAGHFDWHTFWPFAIPAIPMAFLGGLWQLPPNIFKPLIGLVLAFSAVILIIRTCSRNRPTDKTVLEQQALPPLPFAIFAGGILGLLAGLTGTGGGIFLSPLLLLMNWADSKRTAATSIVFVLVNSLAGLGGVFSDMPTLPSELPFYVVAAISGGLLGSWLGARKLPGNGIRILLAVVLLVAAFKMMFAVSDHSGKPDSQAIISRLHSSISQPESSSDQPNFFRSRSSVFKSQCSRSDREYLRTAAMNSDRSSDLNSVERSMLPLSETFDLREFEGSYSPSGMNTL